MKPLFKQIIAIALIFLFACQHVAAVESERRLRNHKKVRFSKSSAKAVTDKQKAIMKGLIKGFAIVIIGSLLEESAVEAGVDKIDWENKIASCAVSTLDELDDASKDLKSTSGKDDKEKATKTLEKTEGFYTKYIKPILCVGMSTIQEMIDNAKNAMSFWQKVKSVAGKVGKITGLITATVLTAGAAYGVYAGGVAAKYAVNVGLAVKDIADNQGSDLTTVEKRYKAIGKIIGYSFIVTSELIGSKKRKSRKHRHHRRH